MVLFNNIVQIFALTDFNACVLVSIKMFQARVTAPSLIAIHQIRFAIFIDGVLQKTAGSLGISYPRQEVVNGLPLFIDCPLIIFPLPFHFDICFIHSPPYSNSLLLSSEGGVQLRGVMKHPAIDGTGIDGESSFCHDCFNIPITERAGHIPTNALENHVVLKMCPLKDIVGMSASLKKASSYHIKLFATEP